MNVFVDFIGHADLYYSMHQLFENRLGWTLFRPDDSAAWQELGIYTALWPPQPLIKEEVNGFIEVNILTHNFKHRIISFDQFLDMDFNLLVTTSHENEIPFYNLREKYKPQAALVRHIANILERPVICKHVLLSTKEPMPSDVQWIQYCPEHPTTYKPPSSPTAEKVIKSFSNNLPSYPQDLDYWQRAKKLLPDFSFKMHGHACDDLGVPQQDLPKAMQSAKVIWHTKGAGGCGYVAREALSCGKPLVVRKDYTRIYRTLAQDYLKDGINCIDIDPCVRSLEDGMNILREWTRDDQYEERCRIALAAFKEEINFEREARQIKSWLLNKVMR